jgi:hypothetical protein
MVDMVEEAFYVSLYNSGKSMSALRLRDTMVVTKQLLQIAIKIFMRPNSLKIDQPHIVVDRIPQ